MSTNRNVICPNCGSTIQLDEQSYNYIVAQVQQDLINDEVSKYKTELDHQFENAVKIAEAQKESSMKDVIAAKDAEILELNKTISLITNNANAAINDTRAELSKSNEKVAILTKDLENSNVVKQQAVTEAVSRERESFKQKEIELSLLKQEMMNKDAENKMQVERVSTEFEKRIAEIEKQFANKESDYVLQRQEMQNNFKALMNAKDEELNYYKNYKVKQSVKVLGESLEKFCHSEFDKIRSFMPNCYFEKDSTVVDGTKGDFIFRDFAKGAEYVSIMFEMKTEQDNSIHKHTNESYLAKLDKDRRAKNCEFAILVTTLEADNDYYNQGIVDVCHKFPKMFIVRPQFFIPIIGIICATSREKLYYKEQLAELMNQNVDVTNFEHELTLYKETIQKSADLAGKKKDAAIEKIDKIIAELQKIKEDLIMFERNMTVMENKADKLTIRKLIKNAPAVAKLFEDNRKAKETA